MKSIFDTFAKYALLRAAVYILLGVLIIIAPETVMNIIVYVMAGYAILMGAISIIGYFRNRSIDPSGFPFVGGVLLVVLGVIMIIFSRQLLSIMPIFLGVLLAIGGASSLVQAIGGASGGSKILLIILSLLIIAAGILVIANPFSSAVVLFIAFGISMVVMGISELIAFFVYKKAGRDTDMFK